MLLQDSKRDGGLALGGCSGDERTALSLVLETRDLADRMDVRGEREGGTDDDSNPVSCSVLCVT